MSKTTVRYILQIAGAASLVGAVSLSSALAAPTADEVEASAQESWRETIARIPAPAEGCFRASYPSTNWVATDCVTAADRPYVPRSLALSETVGNGNDYAAGVSGIMTSAVGTFPTVKGVTSEKDAGANVYSIQLNSNFMTTAACNGGASGCQSWEQFVYSSSEEQAFMQYWLINYGSKCPAGGGWNAFDGSCYKNSAAVSVPKIAISNLANMKLSGTAVAKGNDTLVFTNGTEAYSTTGKDSVVDLATGWNSAEFNIIGDGGGSKATFNKGSSVTVKLAVDDGSSDAPTCTSNAGTTGETNNLTLGTCTTAGGSTPYIEFTETD